MVEILEIIGDKEYFAKELVKVLVLKNRPIFSTIFIHFAVQQLRKRHLGKNRGEVWR